MAIQFMIFLEKIIKRMWLSKRFAEQDNIYLLFIMQKVIQKSLRITILQQISKLNSTNAEFYAILRKLNMNEQRLNQAFSEKLESMKVDIKNKLRQLACNVDLVYQMIDRKISVLIHKIEQNSGDPSVIQQQLRQARAKMADLEQQLSDNKNKYNLILAQNQYLKTKNMALIQQIQVLSRKKANTVTNDSSRNINHKTDIAEEHSLSLENYVSPIQQPVRTNLHNNDLTFSKNVNIVNNLNNINKKIKSEENSFSSMLLKQQNSFQPSYGSDKPENKKFTFGCMPLKQEEMKIQFGNNNILKTRSYEKDEGHRMSFLINNLKDSSQNESFTSTQQNFHNQYSRQQSPGKSVLSRGAVKKYHI